MDQPPKSWIEQLFCKHTWGRAQDLNFYASVEEQKNVLPVRKFRVWECSKCGKITKQQIA